MPRRIFRLLVVAGCVAPLLLLAAAAQRSPRGQVIASAREQTSYTRYYDPTYRRIAYPGGDVDRERGVCTDVLIRAFRAAGVDLQKEVHEDMLANFSAYPQRWKLRGPDKNIDHRRVPNLMRFFERRGKALPIPHAAAALKAGDIVAWDLGGGVLHIGIAVDERSRDGMRLLFRPQHRSRRATRRHSLFVEDYWTLSFFR